MELPEFLSLRNVLLYLLVINLIGFLAMFIDKKKAEKHKWRIPENTLLTITAIGGGIGSIIGMYKFRHKTQKVKFVLLFPIITICEYIMIVYFIIKYII